MKSLLSVLFFSIVAALPAHGQSYYTTVPHNIPGNGQEIYDTLSVSGLPVATLNGIYGLDSVTLQINYSYDEDLVISLIAPDGTVAQLSDNLGGNGQNFDNTCFTMQADGLVNMAAAPFQGNMRPECWLGMLNNGQNGNGSWVLHIINTTTSSNNGVLLKWGIHFDSTPAPPAFFTQSHLPIVVINTGNTVISHITKEKVDGTMGIIDNGGQANHVTDAFNGYQGNISLKVRGSSSSGFPQYSYTVTTTDATGDDNDVSILGMPEESKWVLYGAWDDKSLIRNILTYQLSNEMGDYAPRTRLCELVLDGDYKGVYVFMEKIKRGHDRVNIQKLSSGTVSGEDITGGYMFQVDRGYNPGYDCWLSGYLPCPGSSAPVSFVYEYPDPDDINTAQKNYIARYVDSFETALMDGDLYDTVAGYRHYIDAASFTDQSLLQELGHNVDGYRLSSFLHKDKNGLLEAGPVWDFNLAYGNADYYDGAAYNTFEWDFPCSNNDANSNPFWWRKLATDTVYMQDYRCRYSGLRQNTWSIAHIDYIIDSLVSLLQEPQSRHFLRWPVLGVYLWPNAYVGNTWAEETDYLKSWLHNRIGWMDSVLYDTACAGQPSPNGIAAAEGAARESLSVYPNPARDELNIAAGNNTLLQAVSVWDLAGRRLIRQAAAGKRYALHLRTYDLPAGVYMLLIETDRGTTKKKIVLLP